MFTGPALWFAVSESSPLLCGAAVWKKKVTEEVSAVCAYHTLTSESVDDYISFTEETLPWKSKDLGGEIGDFALI